MVKIEPFELPVGIEAAAWRADAIVKKDKTCPIRIFASGDGHPSVTLFNTDGTVTVVTFIDGAWHEQGPVV